MMRPLAALQAVALLAAALVPAPSPAAAAPADRVSALVGNWTCRDPRGKLTRLAFSADGTALVAHETAPGAGAEVSPPQRYVPVKAGWLVTSVGESRTFSGSAPAWTGATWDIDGSEFAAPPAYAPQPVPERISYERVDANTIRRTVAYGPEHRVAGGEVCTRGDEPPASSLCAAHDVPPRMVRAVEPETPALAQQQGITGTVRVRVSLDAGGQPVAVRIQQSPSAILNSSAIAAARLSTYEPALRDCVPVPSDYLFSVSFSSR
jgi:TonB family protein